MTQLRHQITEHPLTNHQYQWLSQRKGGPHTMHWTNGHSEWEGSPSTILHSRPRIGSDNPGVLWLQEWNPDIDWKKRTIKGGPISTQTLWVPEWAKIGLLLYQAQRVAHNYCLSCDDTVYIQINWINVAQQWAIEASKGKEPVKIPKEYLDFKDVFSDEKAKQLPPTRGEFDHQIKFEKGAPETIKWKVYPMNWAETKFTRNWIQENLASRKIQESQSEITCPSFLIKKKNSAFQMVQDYWPINAWTIPDNLLLPLIRSIVEDLEGMNLFSTFDIWSGYNNVLVKPEDRHQAAFKTTEGQYEPVVMPFGLMNAPATFQWMINHYTACKSDFSIEEKLRKFLMKS